DGEAVEARAALRLAVAGHEHGVAHAHVGVHHLLAPALGDHAGRRRLRGLVVADDLHLRAQHALVQPERLFADAVEEQVGLDLHCKAPFMREPTIVNIAARAALGSGQTLHADDGRATRAIIARYIAIQLERAGGGPYRCHVTRAHKET